MVSTILRLFHGNENFDVLIFIDASEIPGVSEKTGHLQSASAVATGV